MRHGHVRDRFPRISLNLPDVNGPMNIEFVVDTGFDGDLALPFHLADALEAFPSAYRRVRLADDSESNLPYQKILLDWDEDVLPMEVLILEGMPLLGVGLMEDHLLQAEMRDGGEVSLEPL